MPLPIPPGVYYTLVSATLEGTIETTSLTDTLYTPGKHPFSVSLLDTKKPATLFFSGKGTNEKASFIGNFVFKYKLSANQENLESGDLSEVSLHSKNCSYTYKLYANMQGSETQNQYTDQETCDYTKTDNIVTSKSPEIRIECTQVTNGNPWEETLGIRTFPFFYVKHASLNLKPIKVKP